jgi:hypothetical protein
MKSAWGLSKRERVGCIKILMLSCQEKNKKKCEHNFYLFGKKGFRTFFILDYYRTF